MPGGSVLFDLNRTALNPGELKPASQNAVRLATAHTLVGDVRPFAELMEASGGTVPEAMAPLPNVPPGLNRLREQAHRLAVVTQSPGPPASSTSAAPAPTGPSAR